MNSGEGEVLEAAALWDHLHSSLTSRSTPSSINTLQRSRDLLSVNATNNHDTSAQFVDVQPEWLEQGFLVGPGRRTRTPRTCTTRMIIYLITFTFLMTLNIILNLLAGMAVSNSWLFAARTPLCQQLLVVYASFTLVFELYVSFIVLYRMCGGGRGELWTRWEHRTRLNIGYSQPVPEAFSIPPRSTARVGRAGFRTGIPETTSNNISTTIPAPYAPSTHTFNNGTTQNPTLAELSRHDSVLDQQDDLGQLPIDERLRARREVRWFLRERATRSEMQRCGTYFSVGEMKWLSIVCVLIDLFFLVGLGAAFLGV
ncbi:hypothetical protein MMC10_009749 [Thelotrema lepadinum]|nr:hypothetical protein [Thelotrema lepadinum]